ncbi:hypothetical protein MPER_07312, partial [Moniliophthora perniciosa FA553]
MLSLNVSKNVTDTALVEYYQSYTGLFQEGAKFDIQFLGPAFNTALFLNQTFDYGTSFNSYAFAEDYRDTLSSLYRDYMAAYNEWAHSIGVQYSNQPAYNFQIDVAASAAIPDVPEIESLGLPTIDEARQLSGGVHLGSRSIFSSETAARPGFAVSLFMSKLLEDSKLQFAGH